MLEADAARGLTNDGERLYYISRQKDNKLVPVNADGSLLREITSDRVWKFAIHEGIVYYSSESDGKKLYEIGMDGSGKTLIAD